jgi:mercuric ion transport protein
MRNQDGTGASGSGTAAVGASLTGLGAAVTAAGASLCCIGPAAVSIVGVGGAVAAAGLKPYRPLLILASLALIGLGLWFAYRPLMAASMVSACPSRAGRISRIIVWVAAALWLMAILLPYLFGS